MPRKATKTTQRTSRSVRAPKESAPVDKQSTPVKGSLTISPRTGQIVSQILTGFSTAFFVIWTLIGLFVLLIIIQGVRRGVYTGLFANPQQAVEQDAGPQRQTEVDLPGIGTVNIACVQDALSPESLQKVVQERRVDVLEGEERTKFEACITKPAASGEASPSPAAQ